MNNFDQIFHELQYIKKCQTGTYLFGWVYLMDSEMKLKIIQSINNLENMNTVNSA